MLEDLGTAVSGLFDDLGKIDPEQVVSGFTDVFTTVVSGVQWLTDNWESVVGALEGIVIGWGALKITGGVLDIVKVVQGIGGLTSGAAASAGASAGAAWGGAFAQAVVAAAPWLVGLYTLINPAGTAKNDIDTMFANGQVTQAGWDYWNNNQDQWNARLMAVGNRYGDLGTLVNTPEAMNIIGNVTLDDAQVFQQLEETMGLKPVEVPVNPEAPEDAASDLAKQIGTVVVPVSFASDPNYANYSQYAEKMSSHANGLAYVPYDGYLARLHKGERVMTAREVASRNYSSNLYVESMYMNGETDAAGLAAAMAAAQRRQMSGYGS